MNMDITQQHHYHRHDGSDGNNDHKTDGRITDNDSNTNEVDDNKRIGRHDVLCGRGGLTNQHIGNKNFRYIVAEYTDEYLHAKKPEKKEIALRIVQHVHDHGGRFLTRCGGNKSVGVWAEVTQAKALEKSKQALREGLDVRHKTIRPDKHIHRRDSESSTEEENPRKRTRLVQGVVMESPSHRQSSSSSKTARSTATKDKKKKTKKTVRINIPSKKSKKLSQSAGVGATAAAFDPPFNISDVPELVHDVDYHHHHHHHRPQQQQQQYRTPKMSPIPLSSRFHPSSYYPESYRSTSSSAAAAAAAAVTEEHEDDYSSCHGYHHEYDANDQGLGNGRVDL